MTPKEDKKKSEKERTGDSHSLLFLQAIKKNKRPFAPFSIVSLKVRRFPSFRTLTLSQNDWSFSKQAIR